MRLPATLFAAISFASSFARADAIYLQGGRVLEGNATVEGDKVTVELESGRMSFARSEVVRIDKATSALDEARKRELKLAAGDLAGMLELANFCRDHDLPARERALLERIVTREPDHAEARRRLGYVREGRTWVLRSDQLRREQLAQRAQRDMDLERKRQQLALEEATLRRDRSDLGSRAQARASTTELKQAQAQLAREREGNQVAPGWYSPVVVAPASRYWNNGWSHRPALHQPPWNIPGANDPQTNYPINGVRSPQSYYDEAQRSLYGNRPPR
jgi:hypothetical protein